MLSRLRSILGRFDWVLLGAVVLLFVMGIASIWTVALSRDASNLQTVNKQLIAAVIGFVLIFILAAAHYRLFKNYALVIGVGTVALLVLVLFAGRTIRGTSRPTSPTVGSCDRCDGDRAFPQAESRSR